jgi:hypothetical protein
MRHSDLPAIEDSVVDPDPHQIES